MRHERLELRLCLCWIGLAPLAIAFASPKMPPLPDPCVSSSRTAPVTAGELRRLVEEDWLLNLESPLTTASDAAGACDGVKNGSYGFHTGHDAHPWWQVDLGEVYFVKRVVVYNRLDYAPGLHNADALQIFTSLDGAAWTLRHDNQGRHFGGITGAPPLEAVFEGEGVSTRFLRLAVPSDAPVFFHLDEVEAYAAGHPETNIALGKSADQCSLSIWSTSKIRQRSEYPIAAYIERGRQEAARLRTLGVEVAAALDELERLAARMAALPGDADEESRQALYFEVRWVLRRLVFQQPLLQFDRLLFMKRFTQETYPDVCLNHMPWVSRPGGDLCVLHAPASGPSLFAALADPASSGEEEELALLDTLLNGALGPGHVHGMDLWFGGDRIVFGYARAKSDQPPEGWLDRTQSYRLRREEEPIHIFELHLDSGRVRQLTFGEWSDLDPTYAPNGDIVFVSERCGTSLQCNEYDKDETSCNLYVMRPDGSGIRRLSVSKDGDYLPRCLDNGLIAYTRWEYHERSWAYIQSIFTMRPDGTGADALFKQHFVDPWALEEVRSIPGSGKLAAIATGHHTLPVGPLVVIDHRMGVNEPRGISIVTPNVYPPEGGMDGAPTPEGGTEDPGGFYASPWPLSETAFLASYTYSDQTTESAGYGLYYVDVYGNKELIYRDPEISSFSPTPLRPRPTPPILPDVTDLSVDHATCFAINIGHGSEEIPEEQIRYLRIAEPIGWPYDNERGGQRYGEDHRYGGPGAEWKNLTNWTPVRILGDVPVRADGSVQFTVPADRAVYFQLLDENRMELRRMRTFISFQPGEQRSCVGCHETQNAAPAQPAQRFGAAFSEAASERLLAPWGDRPISFLRDVQPVLDAHCVECHTGLHPAGGLDFIGGLTSHDDEISGYGYNRAFETILTHNLAVLSQVRQQDASITPPYAYGAIKSKLIAALKDAAHAEAVKLSEEERLRLTMWIDANGPYHDRFVNKRPEKIAYDLPADAALKEQLLEIHERRCAACHAPEEVTRMEWICLDAPEKSLFLRAPLAQAAGGTQACGPEVYAHPQDADYHAVHALAAQAVDRAWAAPRRDLEALIEERAQADQTK